MKKYFYIAFSLLMLYLSGCAYYVRGGLSISGNEDNLYAYMKNNGKNLDYIRARKAIHPTTEDVPKNLDVLKISSDLKVGPAFNLSSKSVACNYIIGLMALMYGKQYENNCVSAYVKEEDIALSIFGNTFYAVPLSVLFLSPGIFLHKVIDEKKINNIAEKNNLFKKAKEIFKLEKEHNAKYSEINEQIDDQIVDFIQTSEKKLKTIKNSLDMGLLSPYFNVNSYDKSDLLNRYSSCLRAAIENNNPRISGLDSYDWKFYNNSFEQDIAKIRESIKNDKAIQTKINFPNEIDCSIKWLSVKVQEVSKEDSLKSPWFLEYKITPVISATYPKKEIIPTPVLELNISDVFIYINKSFLFDIAFKFEDKNLKITPDMTYVLKDTDIENSNSDKKIKKLEKAEYKYKLRIINKINDEILVQSITLYIDDEKVSEPAFSIATKDIVNENIKVLSNKVADFLSEKFDTKYEIVDKKDLENKKIKIGIIVDYTMGDSLKLYSLKNEKVYKLIDLIKKYPIKITDQTTINNQKDKI